MSLTRLKMWSYSTWKTYNQCPFKVKCSKILKLKEPESPAMARGTLIHQYAQDYVEGNLKELPVELSKFENPLFTLRSIESVRCERELGFTKRWEICSWDDPNIWLRMKIDVFVPKTMFEALVIDYKTGRIYEENEKQVGLYALAEFIEHPFLESITAQLWYLDQGATTNDEYLREEMTDIKEVWNERIDLMFSDTQFPMKPNEYCQPRKDGSGGCWFRRGNTAYPGGAGPCEF